MSHNWWEQIAQKLEVGGKLCFLFSLGLLIVTKVGAREHKVLYNAHYVFVVLVEMGLATVEDILREYFSNFSTLYFVEFVNCISAFANAKLPNIRFFLFFFFFFFSFLFLFRFYSYSFLVCGLLTESVLVQYTLPMEEFALLLLPIVFPPSPLLQWDVQATPIYKTVCFFHTISFLV